MSPEEEKRIADIIKETYGDAENREAERQANIAFALEQFIQDIGVKRREAILGMVLGQLFMDTEATNDEAIQELKSGKVIDSAIKYITDIENVLIKGRIANEKSNS